MIRVSSARPPESAVSQDGCLSAVGPLIEFCPAYAVLPFLTGQRGCDGFDHVCLGFESPGLSDLRPCRILSTGFWSLNRSRVSHPPAVRGLYRVMTGVVQRRGL